MGIMKTKRNSSATGFRSSYDYITTEKNATVCETGERPIFWMQFRKTVV